MKHRHHEKKYTPWEKVGIGIAATVVTMIVFCLIVWGSIPHHG